MRAAVAPDIIRPALKYDNRLFEYRLLLRETSSSGANDPRNRILFSLRTSAAVQFTVHRAQ